MPRQSRKKSSTGIYHGSLEPSPNFHDVDWSVIKKEGNTAVVLLEVTNFSTLQSGTRPPVIGYTEIWKSTIGKWINNSVPTGAMSATSQKIVWIEYIKIKKI